MSQDDLKGNVESQQAESQHTEQVKFAQGVKDNRNAQNKGANNNAAGAQQSDYLSDKKLLS